MNGLCSRATIQRSSGNDRQAVKGLSIFDPNEYFRLHSNIQKIERALMLAKGIIELTEEGADPNTVKANEYVVVIRDLDKLIREAESLKKARSAFESNQMSLLCFLSTNKGERYKAARYVLSLPRHSNQGMDRKTMINQLDQKLKTAYQADTIDVIDY